MVDAILAPASPNRLQADVNTAATYHPSVARHLRRAPSLDSFPAGGRCFPAIPDLGRSASAPAKHPPRQSPPAVCHSYLSPSQSRVPRGSSSHSQVPSSLPSTTRPTASAPRISRGGNPLLDWSPPPRLGNTAASRPIPPEPSSELEHGTPSPPAHGTDPASAPPCGSSPFSSTLPPTSIQGSNPAVSDGLPAWPSSYPARTAPSQVTSSYVGLSHSPGPGPVIVSRTAPPLTTAIGFNHFYKSPPPASIGGESAFSVQHAACPPASTTLHLESGTFSAGTFPSATSALPPGAVSPLYLGAGATPLPSLWGHVSDSTTASPQAGPDTVESLRQQISFLVQAWMADRESSRLARQQTEEVLRRMHVAMENGREQWTSDRTAMERELESLSAQVHQLRQENATLKAAAVQFNHGHGLVSPQAGRRHEGSTCAPTGNLSPSDLDDRTAASLSSNQSLQSGSSRAYIFSPPLGFDGAARRTHFATPGSSRTSPAGPPAPSHVTPLDPRSQPRHSVTVDFMDPLAQNGKVPAPIIDVREIDPRLEGIPIRANAVQRSTFTASAPHLPPATLARKTGQGRDSTATRRARRLTPTRNLSMDRSKFWRLRRASSKDQTLQVLAAEESRRLTMHAGHTPNHSLSLLPAMTATGGGSTGCQSTRATPSAGTRSVRVDRDGLPESGGLDNDETLEYDVELGQDTSGDTDDCRKGHGLHLVEDKSLKGPLMVRNIPAQDDIFFAKLDRKLECVRSGLDALPSVLREPSPVREPDCGSPGSPGSPGVAAQPRQPVPPPPVGGDASHDTGSARESVDEAESRENDIEPDVPLRMRNTSNFGAPFGSAWGGAHMDRTY
ncbi:hypothetical protein G6O67_000011 [Ophiocordyceps sinensis]|uniref:Uncharacterized protein n=1 Tax=Ophiocordyceps sinensis TaxID=72228 RepID=A0A8H4V995_9HYPO|nr:hypothetical protein G6O67_000011 [Ophiocordyceps sinensis]